MDLDLSGRRAIVCGSTAGLGRAAAVELALLGASVTLVARNADKLRATLAELPHGRGAGQEHRVVVCDLSDPASVREAAGQLAAGRDAAILVNNTGGPPGGTAIDATPEAYLAAFTGHLVAAQVLTQAVVPAMTEAGFGRIVNIISTSVKAPIPNLGVSNTVRGAVAAWAKTLAAELGPRGITVNNVLPGYTRTDRLSSLVSTRAKGAGKTEAEIERDLMATIPAGRFGEAHELGAAVAFLCSPAAGYINGINLPVDGGRLPAL
jgi:3-oxoacyl-[acyl-carrier protein] reductase